MSFYKSREIPVLITAVVGLLTIAEFYVNVSSIGVIMDEIYTWAVAVASYCLFLGAINLVRVHSIDIKKRTPGKWYFSIWLVVIMVIFVVVGVAEMGISGPVFGSLFNNILYPLDSTMFAMLSFFIGSACYRALRARSIEATTLLIAGVLVIFATAPIGGAIWSGLPVIGNWVNDVPSGAAMRAYIMAVAIGSIGLGVRILLGMERAHFGELGKR